MLRATISTLPIKFDRVVLAVGDIVILDEVSLAITAGMPTALIGPNGAGKTSLLRLAMGLMAPSAGRLTWNGMPEALCARNAFVFQHPVMLRRTAAANLAFALAAARVERSRRRQRVDELLALVGLDGMGSRPARRLSGGEQQRLALARALAKDPEILFLDEPTRSLDPAAAKATEDVIRTVVARGIKVVMATHDLNCAKRLAGDVVLLHRGRIIETGPAATFFTAPRTASAAAFLAGDLLL